MGVRINRRRRSVITSHHHTPHLFETPPMRYSAAGMDFRKIDAALAGELERDPKARSLNVFIHTASGLAESQAAQLTDLGLKISPGTQRVITADVSPEMVDTLSELPWISRISLARKLRPLSEE
jgi:hypothetical protein